MTAAIDLEPSVLTRDYKASKQMAFDAWTHEQHLCKWQVPNAEVKCDYKFADIKAGGSALHRMKMPSGGEMWLLTQYHALTPPDTIVFTQYESNENGDILPPRMPNWPKEIRATIKLHDLSMAKAGVADSKCWRIIFRVSSM